MSIVFTSFKHPKLPINIRIPVTLLQSKLFKFAWQLCLQIRAQLLPLCWPASCVVVNLMCRLIYSSRLSDEPFNLNKLPVKATGVLAQTKLAIWNGIMAIDWRLRALQICGEFLSYHLSSKEDDKLLPVYNICAKLSEKDPFALLNGSCFLTSLSLNFL